MAKERTCPNPDCGKKTRTQGPFCPNCKAELTPKPEVEKIDNPADADTKKEGNIFMKKTNLILGALFVITLALLVGLFQKLPVLLGIFWGKVSLVCLGLIALGLLLILVNIFIPKDKLLSIGKKVTTVSTFALVFALIVGFLVNNGDLHVKNLTVDETITANKVIANEVDADQGTFDEVDASQGTFNEVDADKVIANEVDANTVKAQEVITEKVTIVEDVPTVTPKTPKTTTSVPDTTISTPDTTTSTPTTSTTSKVSVNDLSKHFTGDFIAPADGVISGDCSLNGTILYDNNDKTFLVFSVKKGDKINCQWVAYYSNIVSSGEMVTSASKDNPGQTQQK